MSDPYSFQGVTPTGLSALAQRLQSLVPAAPTSSPEITDPLTGASPSQPSPAVPGLSALSNFWTTLNTPPARTSPGEAIRNFILGQPTFANEPFATGEGVEYPQPPGAPQRPVNIEAATEAATADPSRLRPDQTQWPPGVEPKQDTKPPDTTGAVPPPEPKKAEPPRPPYIPSTRNRPISELGRPDLPLQFSGRPGALQTPFFPAPHELPGVFANSFRILGGLGSNIIARAALGLSRQMPAYWAAQQRGDELRAKIAANNFKLEAQRVAQLQAAESRAYSEVWAIYGPGTKNYNEETLREELRKVALDPRFQDDKMLVALDRGLPSVEKLMQARDAANTDNVKGLTVAKKIADLEDKRLSIEKKKRDLAQSEAGRNVWRLTPGASPSETSDTAPAGRPQMREGTPEGNLEFPTEQAVPKPAPDETSAAEPREEPDESPAAATEKQEDDTETPEKTAETPAATPEAPAQAAAAPSPSEEVLAAAEGGTPAAGGAPTRLAQAGTGTATDAGPQRAAPPTAELPDWLRQAREGRATPPAAPLETTARAPAAAAAGPPPPKYVIPESPVLKAVRNRVDPVSGQPDPWDPTMINQAARRFGSGGMTQSEFNKLDPEARRYISQQRNWLDQQMDRAIADPTLTGQRFLDVVKALNPQFGGALEAWVMGDAPVPASAWKDPKYAERAIAAGKKIDPTFNKSTYDVRARTRQSWANGQFARQVVSVMTMDFHAERYKQNLQELQKYNPTMIQRFLGPSEYGQMRPFAWVPGVHVTPQMADLMSKLNVDQGVLYTEGARAVSGAAPHQTEMEFWKKRLDFSGREGSIRSAIQAASELREEAAKRLTSLNAYYKATVGIGRDPIGGLIDRWAAGSLAGTDPGLIVGQANEDQLMKYANPDPAVIAHGRRMIAPPAPAPAAAAPAAAPAEGLDPGWSVRVR